MLYIDLIIKGRIVKFYNRFRWVYGTATVVYITVKEYMSQRSIEQRTGLQQPDNGLQDATGRGGVERGSGLKMNFGAREALIGSGIIGLGLLTGSEALAQDNEQEGNFDINSPIGEVRLTPSVRFRIEPTTAGEVVKRIRTVERYQVLAIVPGQRINGNSNWYRVHVPENSDTPIAYVAAGVVESYKEYPKATIAPTETPTATSTAAEQPTPIVTEEVITPTATTTPTPTGTPVIDLPNDMLRPVHDVIDTAPRWYRWDLTLVVNIDRGDGVIRRERMTFDIRKISIDPDRLGTLVDIYGNPVQHGLYTPNNPPRINPELLPQPQNINGTMAEYGYVVGTFAFGVSKTHDDGIGAVTFFAEGSGLQVNVMFHVDEMFGRASIGVQAPNGSEVGTPADDRGRIKVGSNPANNIVINYKDRTITIPTDNGPVVIREGDEIMLAFLWNQEISNYARTWGDQMPSRWSRTVFDDDGTNDPEQIFVDQLGLVVSDRSTRSTE